MGTINYRTGDIITFGSENDFGYEESEIEDYDFQVSIWYDELKSIIDEYSFKWVKVALEYGYYEGISAVVDKNYCTKKEIERDGYPSWFKLDAEDVAEIREELKDLKKLLYRVGEVIPITYPGWCMGYEIDPDKIKAEIDEAVREVWKEVEAEVEKPKQKQTTKQRQTKRGRMAYGKVERIPRTVVRREKSKGIQSYTGRNISAARYIRRKTERVYLSAYTQCAKQM